MGFTNNCLILKNTKELKNKLIQIGRVKERNEGNSEYYDCLLCYEDKFIELDAYDVIDLIGLDENEYTHCVTNEELFLAIAALRDDSDSNQWFTDSLGYWQKCIGSFKFPYHAKLKLHKATIEELIEHFK